MSKVYGETVIPWDLAYALTSVLAGKDLSNDNLRPLTRAILEAVSSAFLCRNEHSNLRDSVQLRAAVEHAYRALLALNVTATNARVVVGSLLKAGLYVCADRTLVVPIPPAFLALPPEPASR